ncbi:MAG TPA: C45 family peptidase, partial [Dehalococcoidales bacterium]|nr:C45 family peptidase [Dehalococcoidales bacterium]
SFAFDGNAAKGGQVIAGQNFDFMADWQDILVLLKIKPDRGPGILALAPAGGLGLVGLNSAGITLNLNLLRNQSSLNPQGGVPTHIILRKVLTSQNLSEAIRKIATAEKRSAKNYLLTSAQGDIINLETTADDLDVSYAEKGILTHANYFKSERFRSTDLAGKFWPDAYIRSQRLLQLMSVLHGRLSVEVMQELLQDHNNYPNSICRHPDPENPIAAARMIKTLVSLISCPQERRIYLAQGNPCEYEYEEYTL